MDTRNLGFDPLEHMHVDIHATMSKKFVFSSKGKIVEQKIKALCKAYEEILSHKYSPYHIQKSLTALSEKILSVITGPAQTRIIACLNTLIKKIQDPTSYSPLTPAIWAGLLYKRNPDQALAFANNLQNPEQKMDAFTEIVKQGGLQEVQAKVSSLSLVDTIMFLRALEKQKQIPIVRNMICLLPLSLEQEGPVKVKVAMSMQDPHLRAKALVYLIRNTGSILNNIIDTVRRLDLKLGNALIKNILVAMAEEFQMDPSDEESKTVCYYINLLSQELREEEKPTTTLRTFRKGLSSLTGFHHLLSKPVTKPQQSIPVNPSAEKQDRGAPLQEKLQPFIGLVLSEIVSAVFGKQNIKNFSAKQTSTPDDPIVRKLSFSLPLAETKRVPDASAQALLQGVKAPSSLSSLIYVEAHIPKEIEIFHGSNDPFCVEFDPKHPIALEIHGKSKISDFTLQRLPGFTSLLQVRSIILNTENEHVEVVFSKVQDGAWIDDSNRFIDLGKKDTLAIPFWDSLWSTS